MKIPMPKTFVGLVELPIPKAFKWLVLWAMIVVTAISLLVIWAYLPDFIGWMAKLLFQ